MTERIIVRVSLRDRAAKGPAGGGQEYAAEGKRGQTAKRRQAWIVAVGVAVSATLVSAYLLIDMPASPSARTAIAESGAEAADRGPLKPSEGRETAAPPGARRDEPIAEPTATPRGTATPVALLGTPPAKAPAAAKETKAGPDALDPLASQGAQKSAQPASFSDVSARPHHDLVTEETPPAGTPSIDDPRVVRAQLSAGIHRREPTGRLELPVEVDPGEVRTIYYFSEVQDLVGHTLMHRWERDGQVMATIPFEVGGKRWRAYSSKRISTHLGGNWRVVLADSTGKELASSAFLVQ